MQLLSSCPTQSWLHLHAGLLVPQKAPILAQGRECRVGLPLWGRGRLPSPLLPHCR